MKNAHRPLLAIFPTLDALTSCLTRLITIKTSLAAVDCKNHSLSIYRLVICLLTAARVCIAKY